MGQSFRKILRDERGFTLVEALIAGAIGLAVLVFAGTEIRRATEVRRLVTKHDVVENLEEKIRFAAKDSASLTQSAESEKRLRACLSLKDKEQGGGSNCETVQKAAPFDLYLLSGGEGGSVKQQLNGSYDSSGRRCKLGCAFTVETSFTASCPERNGSRVGPCASAEVVSISYSIRIEGEDKDTPPFRSGRINIVQEHSEGSDDNLACGLDESNLPRFASGVSNLTPNCVSLPVGNRELKGVKPGSCVMGKEILVGFDPGTREVICVPVKFGGGK